ncbi:MAG: hypothetical protein AAGF57_06530 [Pseudomonadota bacterium]
MKIILAALLALSCAGAGEARADSMEDTQYCNKDTCNYNKNVPAGQNADAGVEYVFHSYCGSKGNRTKPTNLTCSTPAIVIKCNMMNQARRLSCSNEDLNDIAYEVKTTTTCN